MIVEVPIKHAAETKVRGRVKTRWYDAVVPVEVRETSSGEAPLAAWVPLGTRGSDPRSQEAVRSHSDALYRPVAKGRRLGFLRRGGVAEVVACAKDPDCSAMRGTGGGMPVLTRDGLADMVRKLMSKTEEQDRLSEVTGTVLAQDRMVREVVSSTLHERAAEMQRAADRFLCVDGLAYAMAGQPLLRCDRRGYDVLSHVDSGDVEDPASCYPLTRFDEAVASAKAIRSRALDARQVRALRPEVVDASLLDADFGLWMARKAAYLTMRSFASERSGYQSGSSLSFQSRDAIAAYCRLRDAYRTEEPTAVLLSCLTDVEECVNGGLERHLNLDDHGSGRLLGRIQSEIDYGPDLSNLPTL